MRSLERKRDLSDFDIRQRVFTCTNSSNVVVAKVYFAETAGELPERVIIYGSDGSTVLTDVTMA